MLCVKAHLPTKQNADSQKKRVLSVSQKHNALHKNRKIMFLLRPSILAAAMLSCTHLHFISSYVLSLLYMFETPKSFQLRPWPYPDCCYTLLHALALYLSYLMSLL